MNNRYESFDAQGIVEQLAAIVLTAVVWCAVPAAAYAEAENVDLRSEVGFSSALYSALPQADGVFAHGVPRTRTKQIAIEVRSSPSVAGSQVTQ